MNQIEITQSATTLEHSQPGAKLPLTTAQKGFWYAAQANEYKAGDTTKVSECMEFFGEFKPEVLEKAVQHTIQCIDSIRATFEVADQIPVQTIKSLNDFTCRTIDFRSHAQPEKAAKQWMDDDLRKSFDLQRGPLVSVTSLQFSTDAFYIFISVHHLVMDGFGGFLFLQYISDTYLSLVNNGSLPANPFTQLLPAIEADISYQSSSDRERDRDYWLRQLKDKPVPVNLAQRKNTNKNAELSVIRLVQNLPKQTQHALRHMAGQYKVSLPQLLMAVIAIYLYRMSGEAEFVVGVPVSGRHGRALRSFPGMAVNVPPFKISLNPESSLENCLKQISHNMRDLLRHQRYRVEELKRDLNLAASQTELYSTLINIIPFEYSSSYCGGNGRTFNMSLGPVDNLSLIVFDRGADGGLDVAVHANAALFNEAEADRHLRRLVNLFSLVGNSAETPLSSYEILLPEEKIEFVKFNETQTSFPDQALIHTFFENQVAANPTRTALVYEQQSLTYQELNQRANQLAHYLIAQGVKPDTLVGLCLERSFEMVIGILGILKAGGAYVPLDPANPEARLAYQIQDSKLHVLVTQASLHKKLASAMVIATAVQTVCLDDAEMRQHLQSYANDNPNSTQLGLHSQHLAYVIYTSGTTGNPKGVMIEHRALVNRIDWMQREYDLRPSDKVLQKTPYTFDVSVWEFVWTLAQGSQLVIAKPEGHKDPEYLVDMIAEQEISVLHFVPSMLNAILPSLSRKPCPSLRKVFSSGEALPRNVQDQFFKATKDCELHNLYGPTEAAIDVSYWPCNTDSIYDFVPIGKPIQNCQLYVVNEVLSLCPQGVPGELLIGGVGLARAYLNQAQLSAEKFIANPFYDAQDHSSSQRLYKTGDLVRWLADGNLEYLGRIDHQVKLRGLRIELGEIEAQILKQESVREAVVVLADAGGESQLLAYVVANDGATIDNEALRQALRVSLPEYMVPQLYITLKALPLSSNGKVDRKALPKLSSEYFTHAEYVAPQGAIEIMLAEVWKNLLKLEQVSRHDNFFSLGGHSLLVTRLISQLNRVSGVSVPFKLVFETPTLSDLASAIALLENGARLDVLNTPISLHNRAQPIPLSWAQQRLWFIAQLEGGNAAYHIPGSVRLKGELSRSSLAQALNTIVLRHESLRTVFKEVDGHVWQQVIAADEAKFDLEYRDLRGIEDQQSALQNHAQQVNRTPFDLAQGPLIRGRLIQLSDQDHVLLVAMHHIVSDAWSMGVLVRELNTLYEAYRFEQANPLPALPIQYADYAVWQRNTLAGDALSAQVSYWQKHLANAPTLLNLPTDHPRPAMPSYRGGVVGLELDAQLSEQLHALALKEGLTVHMVLHAAWSALLSRLSGQDQVVVGTPVANRRRHEVEGLIGFFVNTLALRVDLSGGADSKGLTVSGLLAQVKTVTLDGYAHQDIPFEQVVECVQPERSLRYTPLFQAMFNFEHHDSDADLSLSGLESEELYREFAAVTPLDLSLSLSENAFVPFDLTLSLSAHAEGIRGNLEYALDLFDHETVTRWVAYFVRLVAEFVRQPDALVHELPILSAAEVQQLVVVNNDNAAELPAGSTIHQLFEAQVAQRPDAIALEASGQQLSYQGLNQRANQLAHELMAQGVQAGEFVGLYLPRGMDIFVSMLAVMKAGAAYVMLDTQQPIERLRHIGERAQLRLVLSIAEHAKASAAHFAAPTLCLDAPAVQQRLASAAKINPDLSLPSDAPALVYVTSGSTGTPKGAVNSHFGIINTMWAMVQELALTPADRVLQFAFLSFDVVIEEIFPAWFAGAAVVLRDEEGLLSPEQLQAMLSRLEISVCELMASYWSLWVRYLTDTQQGPPAHLRMLILGSDAVLMPAYQVWQAFDIPIVNVFGLTETGCTSLVYKAQGPQNYASRLPNGHPLANTQVYILDAAGNPVPEGVMGELCIGGAGVGLGYIGDAELSAERFVANPFSTGRMYKTGDLARWLPGGQVEFIGRRDHQVKLRGFRIELGEIEAQLLSQEVVQDAVVIFDKPNTGEGVPSEGRLVAYLTVRDGMSLDTESLRRDLSAGLPEYMVPAIYIQLDALPLTSSGKVDRKALPAPALHHLTQGEYAAPEGETEIVLAEIWQDLLNVQQVSRHDNFFSLGGHSLLIIRLIAEVQARGLATDVRTVFDHPVLKDLANKIGKTKQDYFQAPANLIPADCAHITPELLNLVTLEQAQIDGLVAHIPGGAKNIQDIYPLGPLQEGILFHHMLASPATGDTYIMPISLLLPNRQQAERFVWALNQVVARHDVLRTAIFWDGLPCPVQVVLRDTQIVANELKLDPSQDAIEQLRAHTAPGKLWMDLHQAPLMRVDLAADPHSDQVYVILYEHHIINDHIGLYIIAKEIAAYLTAEDGKAPSMLDFPTTVPYREFIAHSLMLGKSGETQAYFAEKLGDVDEPTVPFGIYDTQVGAARIKEFDYAFEDAFCRKMRAMCSRLNISIASVFHLAWGVVIGRCSGRDEVVFGTVLSGRLQGNQGSSRSVGLFINTLPIRLSLRGNVAQALKQTQLELRSLVEHEQASMAMVRDCTALSNDAPLFTCLLNYRRAESLYKPGSGAETGFTVLDDYERSNYPLSLNVDDTDGKQFSINLQAIESIDGQRVIEYVRTTMESLVNAIADKPAFYPVASLKELNILSATERSQLLLNFNQNQADYSASALAHNLFEEQAKARPDAIALTFGQQQLSYGELNQRANQVAHYLVEQGVKPDSLVGLCLERSLEMVVGLLGILKAGAAYVPLDPAYPAERLAYQIKDANLKMMVTQASVQQALSVNPELGTVQAVCLDCADTRERLQSYSTQNPSAQQQGLQAQHLAYVIYTSGTTGNPKGVMIEHAALSNFLSGMRDTLRSVDQNRAEAERMKFLAVTTISFDIAGLEIWGPLTQGGEIVLASREDQLDPRRLIALLDAHAITCMQATPTTWQALIESGWSGKADLLALCGGEALPGVLANNLASRCGHLMNCYGPTEATIWSLVQRVDTSKGVVLGNALNNYSHYVLDANLQLVPLGVPGELYIGGASLARGYLNRPELSQERFIGNPFYVAGDGEIHNKIYNNSERLYKTGDLARWRADGSLEFLGRIDHQVKLRGFRIELGEIEAQLLQQEAIREAVVVLDKADVSAEGANASAEARLVAYVTISDGCKFDVEALRRALGSALPEYMVPAIYVELDALPLTNNGKVDRKALPKPDSAHLTHAEYEAAQGATEIILAEIWQNLFNVERISRNDNFFNLGGYSLLAIRLVSAVQQRLDRSLSLKKIFAQPVLKDLSKALDETRQATQAPIALVDRSQPLSLSWAQQRLWFIAQLEGGSTAYHISGSVRLSGVLSRSALEQALHTIVLRHETLRTVFKQADGHVWQEVIAADKAEFELGYHDLSDIGLTQNRPSSVAPPCRTGVLPAAARLAGTILRKFYDIAEQQSALQNQADEFNLKPFDLSHGPLIRGRLIRLSEQNHVLLVTMHHIISDAWSMGVLVQEFKTLYEAYRAHQACPLPPLPVQYADYAAWQRKALSGDALVEQASYWQQHLADAPVLLSLPHDHSRPAMPSYRGGVVALELDARVSAQVRALAASEGLTVHMVLHAVWTALLSRLSGQDQIVVGTPVANRQRHEVAGLIGLFVNTLALRVDLSESAGKPRLRVRDLLAQVKSVTLNGYAQQDMPFEQVVDLVQPERSLRHSPLFQTMFNFDLDEPVKHLALAGLSSASLDLESETIAKFDLSLSLFDTKNLHGEVDGAHRIIGSLEYAQDLFEHETIQRWSTYFCRLLAEFVADLDAPVHELRILPEAERRQLLLNFNQNQADYSASALAHNLFEEQAKARPDAIALTFGQQQLSYGELNQRANQVAHYLVEQGVKPDSLVGLCLERSLEMVVGLLGILKAGAAYVPLDPSYPAERLAYQIKDANLKLMVTQASVQQALSVNPELGTVQAVCLDCADTQKRLQSYGTQNPSAQQQGLQAQHLAYVIYTSGTTGNPKGVMIEHAALSNFLFGMRDTLHSLDQKNAEAARMKFLAVTTISFDIAGLEIWGPLTQGGEIVLASREDQLDPRRLSALMDAHAITCMQATPTTWQALIESGWSGKTDLLALCGGEALPGVLANNLASRCGNLMNCYGPTEATIWSLVQRVDTSKGVVLGNALNNYSHYVLDANLQLVPLGVPGELYIGGASLARGYLNRPELSQERFIANPFYAAVDRNHRSNSERLYKTGDLVRWRADGSLEFLGRIDHQVKLRGFRIELGEIEAQLLQQEAIRDAVVVLDQADISAEGANASAEARLVAYVTISDGFTFDVEALRRALGSALPEYMVPAIYVELDVLPLTNNGKVDRKALPKPDNAQVMHAEYEAPQGETEEKLAQIWQNLLNIPQVSRYDNFFKLGGHSLWAVRLVGEVRSFFDVEITVQAVFEQQSLSAFAALIDSIKQARLDALGAVQSQDALDALIASGELTRIPPIGKVANNQALALSFAQQRLWLIDQIEPGNHQYNEPMAWQLDGELNLDALTRAFAAIVERHQVLRTTVHMNEAGEATQLIHTDYTFSIPLIDLSSLGAEAQEQAVLRAVAEHASKAFDLSRDMMLRVRLLKRAQHSHVLLLCMHHIASDGWSQGILINEFNILYQAFTAGAENPLAALEIQYADYAHWQRAWLQGDVLAHRMRFWKDRLQGLPEVHQLPLDRPRPQVQSYDGAVHHQLLSAEIQQGLHALARAQDATLFMVLNTAFAVFLSRHSNERDIVVGTPAANREQPALAAMVGCFVNTLVLRTDLSGNPSFEVLLQAGKANLLSAYEHQQVPFELLVDELKPERSLSYSPLFQVLLVMQNNEGGDLDLPGLRANGLAQANFAAQYDLSLNVFEDRDGLRLQWGFATAIFDAATIARFAQHFEVLLKGILKQPKTAVAELPLLSTAEEQQLLQTWNNTALDYRKNLCIHDLFEAQVARNPEATALIFEDQHLSYGQLNQKANQVAHYLIAQGVKPDTLVGLCVDRSVEMLVGLLAILKAGGAYVPLDPGYPIERLHYMLQDAKAQFLITKTDILPMLPRQLAATALCLDDKNFWAEAEQSPEKKLNQKVNGLKSNHLAYVIYTSGSTGKPKGVMIRHQNVMNFFAGLEQKFGQSEAQNTWLAVTSICFDISVLELFWTLGNGHKVVLQPDRPVAIGNKQAMDFSLFYFAAREADTSGNKYTLLLEGAKFADQHGLSAVWIPERHFADFGDPFPNPAVAASAVAAITSSIRIRSGSVVLPLHDPIRVAEEWSMVDNISNGRVELSLASGWHPNDFVLMPDDYQQRHEKLHEKLGILQSLWQGNGLMRRNGVGKDYEVFVRPKPVQSELTIWITAAGSPESFRHAGSIGANLLTHLLGQSKEELKEKIDIYRDALASAGYDRWHGKVALMLHTFISDDPEYVLKTIEKPFKNYLRHSINLIKPLADSAGLDLAKDIDALIDLGYERYVQSSGLFGTPERCLARVKELQACGVNEIASLIDFGIDDQTTLENLPHIVQCQQQFQQYCAQQEFLAKRFEAATSPQDLIQQHQITHLQCTPSFARGLVLDGTKQVTLNQLQMLLVGGEPISENLAESLSSHVSGQVFNMYGPTETTVWSSISEIKDGKVQIGKPIANTQFYVLDEYRQLMPQKLTGELYIGGDGVSSGYLGRAELNSAQFISNPFSNDPADRLYKTGDLVRWLADGNLEFVGRVDDQVKIRGFRIELGEVQSALMSHSAVSEAVVVARDEPKRLVAYVVSPTHAQSNSEQEAAFFIETLRNHLKQSLPDYMLPAAFVVLAQLPLTPNGKVNRKALPEPNVSTQLTMQYIAPVTEVEKQLGEIWKNLLKVDRVGLGDNFFELGGHSLWAVRLVAEVRSCFLVDITVQAVFEKQSLGALAALIENAERTQIPVLSKAPEKQALALSFAQQRMWLIDQIEPGNHQYNVPMVWQLDGELNLDALTQAFKAIVERHQVLRTTVQTDASGEAVQVIHTDYTFAIPQFDLSGLTTEAQEQAVLRYVTEDATRVFDLSADMMLRVQLLKREQESHVLLLCMHHIASDGWSQGILVNEFSTLYRAFKDGAANPLAALDIQYADYAHWQRKWLQGEVLAHHLSFWKERLQGLPEVHHLPLDRPRPPMQSYKGAIHRQMLSAKIQQGLNALAQAYEATFFMVLHTAFSVLLARHSNESDIVVGTPVANREQSELAPLVGFFLNTLVLRTDVAGNPSFEALLQKGKTHLLAAYEHQQVPFELLVDELQPERSLSYSPLFQVMLILQNNEGGELVLPGLEVTEIERSNFAAQYDLTLNVWEGESGLRLDWEYATALFDATTIERLAGRFEVLLKGILAKPKAAVSELPLLSTSEEHQLLVAWNDTSMAYPQNLCTHELFEAQVARHPNAIAVSFEQQQLSYGELNQRANQVAHYLIEQGVTPDSLVGLCVERSLEMVVGLLGILKSGAAYVPLDPAYPEERLAYQIKDANLKIILTQASVREALSLNPELGTVQTVCLDCADTQTRLQGYCTQNPSAQQQGLHAQHLAYVIYTSGTTGKPKGVMIEHAALSNFLSGMRDTLRSVDQNRAEAERMKFLAVTTISFDIAGLEIWGPLTQGGEIVLASREDQLDPRRLIALLDAHAITCMQATPTTWQALLESGWSGKADLLALCGGEALPGVLANNLASRCGHLMNCYGPTEATIWSLVQRVDTAKGVVLGNALNNYSHYVLDANLQLVPLGVPGELYIGGASLARGYLNRPELNQERFIVNPFYAAGDRNSSERLYKTGDLVRWRADGSLEFLGRIDHQVKLRGFRIELGEIEAQLLQQEAIRDAVVVLDKADVSAEEEGANVGAEARLVAYVTISDGGKFEIEALRRALGSALPEYMVPTIYVELDALPLTNNGKVDRKALPKPDNAHLTHADYEPPQGETEEKLAQIWQSLLNVKRVSRYDDFFSLGGHSLLAVKLINKIQAEFDLELPTKIIFSASNLYELANNIDVMFVEDSDYSEEIFI